MPFIVSAVTAVAGAISGVLAAGGIGAALVRLGGTLLLSYASQALMPARSVDRDDRCSGGKDGGRDRHDLDRLRHGLTLPTA